MRLAMRGIALALLFAAAPAGALTFTKIAGAPAPEKGDPFWNLGVFDSHDGNTVFGGTTLVSPTEISPYALYAEIGGVLMWIADAPAGQRLGYASIHGDRIAWHTGASCSFAGRVLRSHPRLRRRTARP